MFFGTDFSEEAIGMFRAQAAGLSNHLTLELLDVTDSDRVDQFIRMYPPADMLLIVFCLSAIHPSKHPTVLRNIHRLLRPGGLLLFRDYGLYDCTMLRHKRRLGERLFQRADGTLCYYYSVDDLQTLTQAVGFSTNEISYACIETRNRKTGLKLQRVFLHGVLRRNDA